MRGPRHRATSDLHRSDGASRVNDSGLVRHHAGVTTNQTERNQTERAEEIELLYREHGPRIWRALLGYTGDPEAANDCLAEAFAEALRQWDQIENPAAWLWAVAFRAAGKERRRLRLYRSRPEVAYANDDRALAVVLALAKLPTRQRVAVILHYYGGYTTQQIGDLLGTSASTIGVHLYRARKRLHAILGDEDDD